MIPHADESATAIATWCAAAAKRAGIVGGDDAVDLKAQVGERVEV